MTEDEIGTTAINLGALKNIPDGMDVPVEWLGPLIAVVEAARTLMGEYAPGVAYPAPSDFARLSEALSPFAGNPYPD